ncbi:DEAD/DEAH box helicase family protein [Helcococcus ovis]|uniref:DEAD/DEAH box helicase n=1 Tax=Helcococcus ovis TaxID=72026 RepID=UPI0038B74FBC
MTDVKVYKQKDLVLEVNKTYNPLELNLDEWELYLDILCGEREYQKEAIRNTIIFLASGNYENTEQLAIENFNKNSVLQGKYSNINNFLANLQIRNKLHANIDLATGTGKSYIIFGIAQIMLALGLVERVLVLCPSLTIEKGLTEKFLELASNPDLKSAIPSNSRITNPSIIDANNTIKKGDICIENIHAVYETTGSSIEDSFKFGGEDTLVLNDESHHIYNETLSLSGRSTKGKNIKKWKEFLINPSYNFKYVVGFTGTAYIDNEYFTNVIYRYSLKQAIEDRVVKNIQYISEDSKSDDQYIKFQKIYANHIENKNKHGRNLKPLTIMITKDINHAKGLYEDLKDFLAEWENSPTEQVEKKVLIVTSDDDHRDNIIKLDNVDDKENSVEWIISVSMLTEGWDVKNVFQIVPWEDRAFNSKLLIAQVLGRGLRIPEGCSNNQPSVIVFNHSSWSKNIENLVNEVLEIETRIISSVKYDGDRNSYNFSIYNLDYKKEEKEIKHYEEEKALDYSKTWEDGISLVSQPENLVFDSTYENILTGASFNRIYKTKYRVTSVDELVSKILHAFRIREWEGGILGLGDDQIYDKDNLPSESKIKELILNSMKKVGIQGELLDEDNSRRVMRTFSTLFRKSSKTVSFEKEYDEPYVIETKEMNNESIGYSSLRRGSSLFYSDDYEEVAVNEGQINIIKNFLEDESFPRISAKNINRYLFKTPLNYVFTTETPERKFVESLCKKENVEQIDAWIKSRDRNFYQIEYSYRIGNHQKQHMFNPDFFIKYSRNGYIFFVCVEIKVDGDVSIENKAKLKYGKEHFKQLNEDLFKLGIKEKYIFHFLSPDSYQTFFQYIRNGRIFEGKFKSKLEAMLEKKSGE